jgi:hypothetical protein
MPNSEVALKVVGQWCLGLKPVIRSNAYNVRMFFQVELWFNSLPPNKSRLVSVAMHQRAKQLQSEGCSAIKSGQQALAEVCYVLTS